MEVSFWPSQQSEQEHWGELLSGVRGVQCLAHQLGAFVPFAIVEGIVDVRVKVLGGIEVRGNVGQRMP
jgi:hypothetical protein